MNSPWLRFSRICFLLAVALRAADACAVICSPAIPYYRWVGNMAIDGKCTDPDIQSAIDNMVCPGTIIGVTTELTYPNQALHIANKSLTLLGSNSACDPGGIIIGMPESAPPAPAVTLSGSASGGAVVAITGNSHVTLQGVRITGAVASLGYSGGVAFDGTGALTILDSTIDHNAGAQGGGIYFNGDGGAATLTLGAGAQILFNTSSTDGGGIFVTGQARLFALAPYTWIAFNHAPNGHGGGIAVSGPGLARADIGSPGYNGSPVVYFNDAQYGGGISVVATSDGVPNYALWVRMFTTDPTTRVQVSDNSAAQEGGAVYVKSNYNLAGPNQAGAAFCATDFGFDDNIASDGAALYADLYDIGGGTLAPGGYLQLNPETGCYGPETAAALGGVGCGRGTTCNTLYGNVAEDPFSNPTGGAVITGNRASTVTINRFDMRNSQAGRAIDFNGVYPTVGTCLIAGNAVSAELIRILDSANGNIDGCTFTGNTIGGASVIYSTAKGYPDVRYGFYDTIIDQPNVVTAAYGDNSALSAVYLLSNDVSTLPQSPAVVQGAPTFVDAAGGDYRLQVNSLGVDFAPQSPNYTYPPNTSRDLAGVPRVFDLSAVPNHYGARDLGAYETVPACFGTDTLFCNGYDPTP